MDSKIGIAVLLTEGAEFAEFVFPYEPWPDNAMAFVNKNRDTTTKWLYYNKIPFYFQSVNNLSRLRNAAIWFFRDCDYIVFIEDIITVLDSAIVKIYAEKAERNNFSYITYSYQTGATPAILPGFEIYNMNDCKRAGALNLSEDDYGDGWRGYIAKIAREESYLGPPHVSCSDDYLRIQNGTKANMYVEKELNPLSTFNLEKIPMKQPTGTFYLD